VAPARLAQAKVGQACFARHATLFVDRGFAGIDPLAGAESGVVGGSLWWWSKCLGGSIDGSFANAFLTSDWDNPYCPTIREGVAPALILTSKQSPIARVTIDNNGAALTGHNQTSGWWA
jgi:hypothetical protein